MCLHHKAINKYVAILQHLYGTDRIINQVRQLSYDILVLLLCDYAQRSANMWAH